MTTTARALRVHGIDDLRIDDVDGPEPSPDEAVVRIEYGGICGSDLHYWRDGAVGASVLKAPMTLGHEVVGTVSAAAVDGSGPAAGTPVAVHPAVTCGACTWCLRGQENRCVSCRYLGSAAQWPHTDGGFATTVTVRTDRLLPLPAGLSLERAALAEPTAIAWHAVDRAPSVGAELAGAHVLVVGAGPIGLLVAAVARHRGAGRISVTDVRPRPLEVARRLGVDDALPASELVRADAPLGADIVFESSGAPAGLATALRQVQRGGTVVAVGQLPQVEQGVEAWRIVTHELTVTGSLRMHRELGSALDFLARPTSAVDPVISHVFPLDAALDAFAVAANTDASSKVLLRF